GRAFARQGCLLLFGRQRFEAMKQKIGHRSQTKSQKLATGRERQIAESPPVQWSLQKIRQIAPFRPQPVGEMRGMQWTPLFLLNPPVRRRKEMLTTLEKGRAQTIDETRKGREVDPFTHRHLHQ